MYWIQLLNVAPGIQLGTKQTLLHHRQREHFAEVLMFLDVNTAASYHAHSTVARPLWAQGLRHLLLTASCCCKVFTWCCRASTSWLCLLVGLPLVYVSWDRPLSACFSLSTSLSSSVIFWKSKKVIGEARISHSFIYYEHLCIETIPYLRHKLYLYIPDNGGMNIAKFLLTVNLYHFFH